MRGGPYLSYLLWRNRPDPDQPFFAVFNSMCTHEMHNLAEDPGYKEVLLRMRGALEAWRSAASGMQDP